MSKRKPLPTYVWQATVDGVFYRGTIEWDEVELDGD